MTSPQKCNGVNWDSLGTAEHIVNMFRIRVCFKWEAEFTRAQHSLPLPLMAKIHVSHEWNGQEYMVCQMIFTEEMRREDLVQLVTMVREAMDGKSYDQYKEDERKLLCQNLKNSPKEKTTLMLESKDPLQKNLKE